MSNLFVRLAPVLLLTIFLLLALGLMMHSNDVLTSFVQAPVAL